MRKYIAAIWLALAAPVIGLSGCEAIGLQKAQGFEEHLAYALGQTTAVRQSAAEGVRSGALSVKDAEYVLKVTDETRAVLDAARAAYTGGDVSTAEGRLALATSILTQLQAYLRAKG